MSHNLEILADGSASMAYVGEVPWHSLGVQVPADLTPAQIQAAAGLDWTVKKCPSHYNTRNGAKRMPVSALVRESDGLLLDVVPNNWNTVQNSDAFDFFNDFCVAGEMEMHTAGSLNDGNIVWAMAKVKESFELFGGDKVEGNLLFINPHKYGKTINIFFTPVRVVCNNTLTLALGMKDNGFRQTHRTAFNPDIAKEAIGITAEKMEAYKAQAQFLGSKNADIADINNYLAEVFPSNSKKDDEKLSLNARRALEQLDTQDGAEFAQGTWWQAFNAVTWLIDHSTGNPDARLDSIWFGKDSKTKQTALVKAMEYANQA